MGKITGMEKREELPEKVRLLYEAVVQMFDEGSDLSCITVSGVAGRAGIGKGTVYEYFDTKEDLIVCAVLHVMRQISDKLLRDLEQYHTFQDRISCLMDWVENSIRERQCFIRFLHLLTDGSGLGQLLRQRVEARELDQFMPMTLFQKLLQQAIQEGEIRGDLPVLYMSYTIYSRLAGYVIFLCVEDQSAEGQFMEKQRQMRKLVYQGLMKELAAGDEKNKIILLFRIFFCYNMSMV